MLRLRKETEQQLAESVGEASDLIAGVAVIACAALIMAGIALVLSAKGNHA
jgi:hypothetical protein